MSLVKPLAGGVPIVRVPRLTAVLRGAEAASYSVEKPALNCFATCKVAFTGVPSHSDAHLCRVAEDFTQANMTCISVRGDCAPSQDGTHPLEKGRQRAGVNNLATLPEFRKREHGGNGQSRRSKAA